MEIYQTLVEAVQATCDGDTRRIYRVDASVSTTPIGLKHEGTSYVVAASPAQACLAMIGEDNVSLVSQRDRYDATREALRAKLEEHNAAVEAANK